MSDAKILAICVSVGVLAILYGWYLDYQELHKNDPKPRIKICG